MFWQPETKGLGFLANESESFPQDRLDGVLRPLGFMENGVATAHTYGSSNIVYALRMFSSQPLNGSQVKDALRLIQTKIQNLRACIKKIDGVRYFAEMSKSRVLFEERHHDDWMEEYETQLQAIFDVEEGPLWSAVFLTMPEANRRLDAADSSSNYSLADEHLADPEHRHLSMLVLTFCHAISDGASNAVFCNMLLSTLNCLIEGDPVPEEANIPLQVPLEDMELKGRPYLTLRQISSTIGHLWSLAFPPTNQYLSCFSTPSVPRQTRMRTYSLVLSRCETARLVAVCRQNGVSVHAAFTAAASVALFRIVTRLRTQKRLPRLQAFNIGSGHVVNFRRYMLPRNQNAYGCYMGFFETHVEIAEEVESKAAFWDLVRTVLRQMNEKLNKEQQPVVYCKLMQKCLSTERWIHRQHTKRLPHVSHYFGTSNMGDLDRIFNANGKHVEVTRLVRTTNIGHDLGMVYAHMFHTLRGRLMYNLDYLVSVVTEQQAKQYAEETLFVIKSMSS